MRTRVSAVIQFCALAIAASAALTTGAVQAADMSSVAAPSAAFVPANAAFYVGWAGKPQNWPGYSSSRLAKILRNSHIADFFTQDVPAIIAARANGNPGTMSNANHAGKLAALFFNHPFALYVLPRAKGQSRLSVGMIVQAGKDRDKILADLKALHASHKYSRKSAPLDSQIGSSGPWVYDFINPAPEMLRALTGQYKTLNAAPKFQQALPHGIAQPVLGIYLNFAGAKGDESLLAENANGTPQARMLFSHLNPDMQSKQYKTYAMTAGFVDGQWQQDNFLAYRHPPMHPGHAVSLLKLAPVDALSAAVFHLNLTTVSNGLLAAAKVDGQGKQVNQALQTVNQMTGVDLQQDMINALGAHWLMYELPSHGLAPVNGYVLANRLRHPNRLMQALAVLMPVAVMGGNAMARQHGMSAKTLSLNAVQMGDVTINEVGTASTLLCYAIDNNNFFITLNLNTMRAAITQEKAKTSVLNNPAFKGVLAKLGNPRSASTISFTDSPKLLPAGYQLLTQEMQTPLSMAGIQLPVPLNQIAPPLTALKPAIEPSGSASWFDSAGWHQRSISAFPLAGIFTAQSPSHYLGFFSSAWTANNPEAKTAAAPASAATPANN